MKNNMVTVLDFGSSKINVLVGKKGVNNNFNILINDSLEYAGFMQGKFLLESGIKEELELILNNVQSKLNNKIDSLFIGVPAEFCYSALEDVGIEFKIPTKLKQKHLDSILCKLEGLEIQNKTLIGKAPIEFKNELNETIAFPINETVTSLKCTVSEVFVCDYFLNLISDIMNELQIFDYQFISPEQVMGYYLLDSNIRKNGAVIVDVGYITTSVIYSKGDGIQNLKSFSMGGGHVTSDLAEVLNLSYESAEELKRKLILTLKPTVLDTYELCKDLSINVSATTANEIAFARIDLIISNIEKCLKKMNIDNLNTIYLTGGGLSYLKGIKHYLKIKFKKEVKLIAPQPLHLHKYELSSAVSILNIASDFT